ncbi:MAG TPA: immunoglobulin domain-containing protein, partial [Streptosporangiaceae bacterium]
MATRLVSLIRVVPVFGLVVLSLAAAGPAQASTTLTVSTTSDTNPASGPCASGTTTPPSPLSLRDAVCVANNLGGTVTISVPSGTYDLSFGELDAGINAGQNVTISGAGAASTTISGQGNSRVLNIDENLVGGIAATVSGVTITGGSDSTFGGAGIIAGSGDQSSLDTLTITNCVITGNHANLATPTETNNPGGGLQFIGGKLSITGSTFSDNSAASSPGAAVFYEAQGEGSPESFSMSGSTISGNTGANTTGSSVPTDGAVDLAAPGGGISMQVTDSVFTSNAMTGTSGPVRGAALTLEGGTASVTNSNFSGNSVTGSTSASGGGAIAVVTGTATVTNDRIVGNQAQSAAVGGGLYNDNGTVTATNDWWGCNAGPGSTGCDTVSGTVTTNPRIELTASPVTLASASTAPVTGDLNQNSAGQAVTGPQNELDGVTETFTSPLPAGATCTPGSVAFSGGTASASCTFNPNGNTGAGSVVATVDNQSITVPVTITQAPAITTQPSDVTVPAGGTATFTAAASGYPAPTVQWKVSTDGGSTYTNVSGATSPTLSFTATAGDAGNLYEAVFTNSTGTATTNPASLSEQQAPAFTSASSTTFTAGTAGTFEVTTSGFPNATLSESGSLPSGVTFTDNGNGTGTLAGTPASGAGGSYPITLTASNGVSPDATQSFTLNVSEAPSITSGASTTFVAGSAGTFTVTTTGHPAAALTESGSLPSGVTFHDNGDGTATLAGTP